MFDWKVFLDKHNVEWRTEGQNIKRGNIGICCPLCGSLDTNFHLGINLSSPESKWVWSCWKDPSHKGNTPYYLVQTIAKCSLKEAKAIVDGDYSFSVDLSSLLDQLDKPRRKSSLLPVEFSENEFRLDTHANASKFHRFLRERGFDKPKALSRQYDLRGANLGKNKDRVIFPLTIDGVLYGWTGRAIVKSSIRYKTYPNNEQNIQNLVYNFDKANEGGEILFICEGPFDAIKVDYYGKQEGIRAVAILGLYLPINRAKLISRLIPKYKHVRFLLDSGEEHKASELRKALPSMPVGVSCLDPIIKDPGDLTKEQVLSLYKLI